MAVDDQQRQFRKGSREVDERNVALIIDQEMKVVSAECVLLTLAGFGEVPED